MARSLLNADTIEFHKIMPWIRTIMLDLNKTKFRTFELNRFLKCNQALQWRYVKFSVEEKLNDIK